MASLMHLRKRRAASLRTHRHTRVRLVLRRRRVRPNECQSWWCVTWSMVILVCVALSMSTARQVTFLLRQRWG